MKEQFSISAIKMLFALLRATFKTSPLEVSLFEGVSAEVWENCYRLALEQGVRAAVWDGIMQLPEALQPPIELKIKWALEAEETEQLYIHNCQVAHELTAIYHEEGIQAVVLKGLGLSVYYPHPTHRENGDIDFYTCSAIPHLMSHKKAQKKSIEVIRKRNINVNTVLSKKHSIFYYKDTMIENHRNFLNIHSIRTASAIDRLLYRIIHPTPLVIQEKYRMLVPGADFNTIFIAYHAAQHFGSGICLHHLYDWACFLHKEGLHIPDELTDKHFSHFIFALTALTNKFLDTHINVPDQSELEKMILKDMLEKPFSLSNIPVRKAKIFSFKLKRLLYLHQFEKRVFGTRLWQTVSYSILFHLKYPQTIWGQKSDHS